MAALDQSRHLYERSFRVIHTSPRQSLIDVMRKEQEVDSSDIRESSIITFGGKKWRIDKANAETRRVTVTPVATRSSGKEFFPDGARRVYTWERIEAEGVLYQRFEYQSIRN